MKPLDYVVIFMVCAAFILALRGTFKQKKKGCCGSCEGCKLCGDNTKVTK